MTRVNSGIKFEYLTRDYFRARGFQVIRAAGSHGAADLIVWRGEDVRLLQCKKELTKRSYEKDMKRLVDTPVPGSWKKRLWVKRKSEVWVYDVHEAKFGIKVVSVRDINNIIRGENND